MFFFLMFLGQQVYRPSHLSFHLEVSTNETGKVRLQSSFIENTFQLSALQNNTEFWFSALVYGLYVNLCFSGT